MNQIRKKISNIPEGKIFTYKDFGTTPTYALTKALSRLVKEGKIKRILNGSFYKPKKTVFGELSPGEEEIFQMILLKDTKSKGYITGLSIYNKLGLTTQVSNEIVISYSIAKKPKTIGTLKVRFVKGITPRSKQDIEKLQILDAIRDFKNIPDRNNLRFIKIISTKINTFSESDLERMFILSKKYNASTRALFGAILELNNFFFYSKKLKDSLNVLTKYKLNISSDSLPNKKTWNIV